MADIWDWSATAASNTTVDGVGINTNMSIADIDNAFRTMMAVIRNSLHADFETFLMGSTALTVPKGGSGASTLTGILKGNGTGAFTAIAIPTDTNAVKFLNTDGTFKAPKESFIIKITDDATAVTSGTGKGYFRMPYAVTLEGVRAALATGQSSGGILTIDINKNGSTILSTKLTIDNGEVTSTTAVTAPVISGTALADDDVITVDVDSLGDGTAKGLTITLIGRQT